MRRPPEDRTGVNAKGRATPLAQDRLLQDFIDLGREILRWDRREAYGADWSLVAPSPPAIGLASPGFLGEDYRGVVLLAQYPGHGEHRGAAHRRWDRLLSAWRDQGTLEAYRESFKFYLQDFQQVVTWSRYSAPVLRAAGLKPHDVAYLNLGKSPLVGNPASRSRPVLRILKADWHWTRKQIEVLDPRVVVAGGLEVERVLHRFWLAPPFVVIPQNRDRSQNKATLAARTGEIGRQIREELRRPSPPRPRRRSSRRTRRR